MPPLIVAVRAANINSQCFLGECCRHRLLETFNEKLFSDLRKTPQQGDLQEKCLVAFEKSGGIKRVCSSTFLRKTPYIWWE